MARLWTTGFEWNHNGADGMPATGTVNGLGVNPITLNSATFSTVNPRTGTYALRQAAAGVSTVVFAGALASTYYFRSCVYLSSLPAAALQLIGIGTASSLTRINVNPDGSLDLKVGSTGGTLLGSSSAGAVSAGSYFTVEIAALFNSSSSDDYTEGRLNGVSFASATNTTITTLAPTNLFFCGSDGTITVDNDDLALNDNSGAAQNSWPGSGKVFLLKPISLNTNGGSWTDDNAATTSAALTTAIDNTPPVGIADTTAGGGGHQVRNAAANSNLDMNLTTYTTAGIGASDTINVLQPMANVGAPVSTGAKSGSFGISSNPVIANRAFTGGSGTATFFWRGAAVGTYPANWGWENGTTTYGSTVTVGSSPVARLSITAGTTSRVAMCDAMGLYVDYTPAVPATKAPPFQARPQRNFLLRR